MAGCLSYQPASRSFSGAFDRVADVAYPHRRAVAIGDDEVLVRRRLQELIVGVQRVGDARAVERALGQIDVGAGDDAADVLEADAAGGERLRIDPDANGGLLLATDPDQADARNLRDLRQQDVFGIGIDRRQRQRIRRQRDQHDRRLRGIHFPDGRRIGDIGWQIRACRVDRRKDVRGCAVDRARKLELHGQLRHAERAGGGELRDAGNLAQLLLQRRGDR